MSSAVVHLIGEKGNFSKKGGTPPPLPREVNSRGSSPAVGRFAPSGLPSLFPRIIEVILALFLTIAAMGLPSEAVTTFFFCPKVGSAYSFEVASSLSSEFTAFETNQPASIAATGTVTVRVIGFRQGMYILDIWENENHTRRFLKPDGTVLGAPGEEPTRLPFFWSLPAGDWEVGQVHRIQKSIPVGSGTVLAAWDLTFKDVDAKTGRARLEIAGHVGLPSDRLIQRSIHAKGMLFFNPAEGCFDQGDWTVSYSLSYSNKEIAVMRDLWNVVESRRISFRLKGVSNE